MLLRVQSRGTCVCATAEGSSLLLATLRATLPHGSHGGRWLWARVWLVEGDMPWIHDTHEFTDKGEAECESSRS